MAGDTYPLAEDAEFGESAEKVNNHRSVDKGETREVSGRVTSIDKVVREDNVMGVQAATANRICASAETQHKHEGNGKLVSLPDAERHVGHTIRGFISVPMQR